MFFLSNIKGTLELSDFLFRWYDLVCSSQNHDWTGHVASQNSSCFEWACLNSRFKLSDIPLLFFFFFDHMHKRKYDRGNPLSSEVHWRANSYLFPPLWEPFEKSETGNVEDIISQSISGGEGTARRKRGGFALPPAPQRVLNGDTRCWELSLCCMDTCLLQRCSTVRLVFKLSTGYL